MKNEKGGYNKSNILTWNSSISYNTLKESIKLSEMTSNVRVKSLSGSELFRVRMYHNFYKLEGNEGDYDREPIDQMLNIWGGELPRLTRMNISTNMNFKLFGSAIGTQLQNAEADTTEDIEDEFYSMEQLSKPKKEGNNIWESQLRFKYSADWKHTDEEWDYRFSLETVSEINLSKNWRLFYKASFNLKEREMTYHSFSIYRPLHCWEFDFKYWPQGISSGFSLEIKVKNPELQDIKLTSKDGNRVFRGF
jgi:DNA-binding Lrp family transcriptional regulator